MPYGANASNPEATRTLVGEAKGPGPEISRSEAVGFLLGNRPAPSNKSLSGRSYASTDDALQWPAFERRVSIPVARSGLKVVCSNSSKPRAANTAISASRISTAKHGQSPQDPNLLRRIDDGAIVTAINSAWDKQIGCASNCTPLIVAGTDDDLWQSYLSVKTQGAADFVKAYLWTHSAPGVTYNGTIVSVPHSGLAQIYAGQAVANFFGVPYSDPRHPDVFGIVQVGVVYTTGSKIAEHGGDNAGDRDVPILVYAPGTVRPGSNGQSVETTQVAPTILRLLGLDPLALQAVVIEHTQVLPLHFVHPFSADLAAQMATQDAGGQAIAGYYTVLSPASFALQSRWTTAPHATIQ